MLPGVSTSSWNNPRFCSFEKENGTYLSKRCKGAFWAEKGALSSRLLYVARIPCVEALKRQIFLTLFQHFFHCWLERFPPLYFAIHGPAAAAVPSSWTTSPFLAAKELVANIQEKRALSTKKGSPGTFSKFQGRAEPLMRLPLLCLFPLNSQLPCQEWHFSIASSKKVHLESSRGAQQSPLTFTSPLFSLSVMAPTITYSRMHISISKGQFSFLHIIKVSNWHSTTFSGKQVISNFWDDQSNRIWNMYDL